MIHSGVHIGTNSKLFQRGSGHFHIIDQYKYCKELDLVIQVANSKGYQLPTDYQLRCLNVLINERISNGIWAKRDLSYVFGYGDITGFGDNSRSLPNLTLINQYNTLKYGFPQLNLKSPLQYQAIPVPSAGIYHVITKNGFCKVATSSDANYLEITFNPSTNAVKYTLNDCSVSSYLSNEYAGIIASTQPSGVFGHLTDGTNFVRFNPYNGSTLRNGALNTTAFDNYGTPSTTAGYHHFERTSSTALNWFVNGISVQTRSRTTSAIPNVSTIRLSERLTSTISSFDLGGSLGSTLQKIDYEIFTQFRSKLNFS